MIYHVLTRERLICRSLPLLAGGLMLTNAILRGYAAKQPTQWPVYNRDTPLDRASVVTASEIGLCERQIRLSKEHMHSKGYSPATGTEVDPNAEWGFFERGHSVETWVVDTLRRGWNDEDGELLFTGTDQVSFVDNFQSGTPDGIIIRDNTVSVFDIKSIDPRTNIGNLPKREHTLQVIQNTDLVSFSLDLIPTDGVLLYVDASNYKKIMEFPVAYDEAAAERLAKRANRIMNAVSPAALKPEGLFMKDGCKYCKHTAACNRIMRENGELGNDETKAASARLFGQP